jgi:hypothetical protein
MTTMEPFSLAENGNWRHAYHFQKTEYTKMFRELVGPNVLT